MEYESVLQNLSINFVDFEEQELIFVCKDEKLKDLVKQFKNSDSRDEKSALYDQIIATLKSQLKTMETVGQILDIMKVSVKMLLIENCVGEIGIILLNEIFQLLPKQWEEDPVKVHLITKTIYETLNQDFNNTFHILNKIINFNRLGFYVALTLFWSLYLHFFKKDTHHYYKMYDVNKFFKLLQSYDKSDDKEMELNTIFQLLLLISIYQCYVLHAKDKSASNHGVFQDFFKVGPNDCEKLKTHLSKMKILIQTRYPVGANQNSDALMLVEYLELNLGEGINQESNQQFVVDMKNMEHSEKDGAADENYSSREQMED